MQIRILMITHNRPTYTYNSLSRLCDTLPSNVFVTIWDNGSSIETLKVLKKFENHQNINKIIYSRKNLLLHYPTNYFWGTNKDADFLAKVDDDCLVPFNWINTLLTAHKDIDNCGILSCWHFRADDFVESIASKKIFRINGHQILRNCWVGGSGYIMNKNVIDTIGLLRKNESFTTYCIRAASKGFINGWYYPFLYQDHMDDPRSKHFMYKYDDEFQSQRPLTAKNFNINSIEEWMNRLKESAYKMQTCSIDPKDYIGFRAKIRIKYHTLLGKEYLPTARPIKPFQK